MLRRMYSILRSRKLAVWLIAVFVAYAAVATLAANDGNYSAPYDNPIFFLIAAALTIATAACAWERTLGAYRAFQSSMRVSSEFVSRLHDHPQMAVPVGYAADSESAVERASIELRRIGLIVRPGKDRLVGSSARVGLIGSPLFHWSLVLLFVFVALGQLTRAEGLIGIPVGSSRLDSADVYGRLDEGPFHSPGFTGLVFRVPDLELGYTVGGVDRGAVPLVEVYDGEELIASQRVYPNSPLRYRSLLIHSINYGLAARFVLEGSGTSDAVDVLYDFEEGSSSARNVTPIGVSRSGSVTKFETSISLDQVDRVWVWDVPRPPQVSWKLVGSNETSAGVLHLGESMELGDGGTLRLEGVTRYARLSVVDDWSVAPIYVLFLLAGIGLTLALLLPPKTAWVMLVERDGQLWLHARTRQSRADRVFQDRVEAALRTAVDRKGDDA